MTRDLVRSTLTLKVNGMHLHCSPGFCSVPAVWLKQSLTSSSAVRLRQETENEITDDHAILPLFSYVDKKHIKHCEHYFEYFHWLTIHSYCFWNKMPLGKDIGLASSLLELLDFVKQCLTVLKIMSFFPKLSQNMVHHDENVADLWQKNKTRKPPKLFQILKWFFRAVKKAVFWSQWAMLCPMVLNIYCTKCLWRQYKQSWDMRYMNRINIWHNSMSRSKVKCAVLR